MLTTTITSLFTVFLLQSCCISMESASQHPQERVDAEPHYETIIPGPCNLQALHAKLAETLIHFNIPQALVPLVAHYAYQPGWFIPPLKPEFQGGFIIIIGNKIDLLPDLDKVNKIQHELYNKLSNCNDIRDKIDYAFISARTAQNFDILKEKIDKHGKDLAKLKYGINYKKKI